MTFKVSSKHGTVLGQYETFHEAVKASAEDNDATEREIVIEEVFPSAPPVVAAKMTWAGSLLVKKEYLALALRMDGMSADE